MTRQLTPARWIGFSPDFDRADSRTSTGPSSKSPRSALRRRPTPPTSRASTLACTLTSRRSRINAMSLKDLVAWVLSCADVPDCGTGLDHLDAVRYQRDQARRRDGRAIAGDDRGAAGRAVSYEGPQDAKGISGLRFGARQETFDSEGSGTGTAGSEGVTVGGSGSRDGVAVNLGRGASYTFANNKLKRRS